MSHQDQYIDGTAVAVAGAAVLIMGTSGSGKSTLALDLMSRGAELVSDDKVLARRIGEQVVLSAPQTIAGMIEARGVGLLAVRYCEARLKLIVDLDAEETARLPQQTESICGVTFPLIRARGRHRIAGTVMVTLCNDFHPETMSIHQPARDKDRNR
ncbi:MAG: HPr kinase/phosphatase C-terminal domain-containing protein [Rhodobacteraceae bacterium]|nr:HPr kinase/phosphatase C-terminal domain-containing protein [Paracoccaceae bacterium]MCY4197510.1 HPr kinase/phosphatase C-terminal domain-containing protein [Paracoccaceae bacterium]MCY4327099.1 HPr kinase/phosphatase C-terminal domain-containing protein [Paracoccaceae bacterium]